MAAAVSKDSTFLIAISGGVDSVVLAHLMKRAGFTCQLAHMNFQLRGKESDRDEQFVAALAKQWEVQLHIKRANTTQFAEENKLSLQEAARELRYEWFAELRQQIIHAGNNQQPTKNCWILTAHHADDNIETLLLHLMRGTGLEGLAGIQPIRKNQNLIRPLLPFFKNDLLAYAQENELAFVEDSSNASDHYTRNKLRHLVMPTLREIFPDVDQQLSANIERFREGLQIYRKSVTQEIERISDWRNNEKYVSVAGWKKMDPLATYTWEIIHPFGFQAAQIPDVIKLLESESGRYCQSSTHRIIRHRQHLVIAPLATQITSLITIDAENPLTNFSEGSLKLEKKNYTNIPNDAAVNEIYVPADSIQFPLLLRRWQQGDYFYPLGLNKKKKISRLLIDLKLSATEKEKIFVLETNKKIIWVVGIRLDHRFRLQKSTGEAWHLTYLK
ncbi:MAG: tRNA lysidine(34) synthetase TilS [Chitinophagaceae bacterium]|nr:tRNA lysidine(34) synthetase TilS [Chitinophagaceae bacterium]